MFSVQIDRGYDEGVIEAVPIAESIRFSTSAVGGFSSCGFSVSLPDYKRIPHLARVRLHWGSQTLWEGEVQDKALNISGDRIICSIDCYGYMKMLEETSVRKIWSLRSIPWRPNLNVTGLQQVGGVTPALDAAAMFVTTGQFDPTDLSRSGILVDNVSGSTPTSGEAAWAIYIAPEGVQLTRVYTLFSKYTTSPRHFIQESADGETWVELLDQVAADYPNGERKNWAISANTRYLIFGGMATGSGNRCTFEETRILGSELDQEDTEGGFWGGTLVRSLMRLVPGLDVGQIDDGDDFTITSLARTARDSAMSVLQEVSAFYEVEWGVWEDKKFSWTMMSKDDPHWVIPVGRLNSLDLRSTTDGLAKRFYMLYENAATGEPEEQSEDSGDARNPYPRLNKTKDLLLTAPTVMMPGSAGRLAERMARDRGGAPVARGRLSIPALAEVDHVDGTRKPAMFLRGGDNVLIPDVPTDQFFQPTPGNDGQTLFHIRSTETDMSSGETSIELDAFAHSSDVIMARVAAVTRIVTGG